MHRCNPQARSNASSGHLASHEACRCRHGSPRDTRHEPRQPAHQIPAIVHARTTQDFMQTREPYNTTADQGLLLLSRVALLDLNSSRGNDWSAADGVGHIRLRHRTSLTARYTRTRPRHLHDFAIVAALVPRRFTTVMATAISYHHCWGSPNDLTAAVHVLTRSRHCALVAGISPYPYRISGSSKCKCCQVLRTASSNVGGAASYHTFHLNCERQPRITTVM